MSVHANEPPPSAQQKSMNSIPCPMMGNMDSMQKNMGDMMGGMKSMMQMMSDPAMKERMQKMHEEMGAPGGKAGVQNKNEPPAAIVPEDHESHHPDKK
jgi:hypothetical protein